MGPPFRAVSPPRGARMAPRADAAAKLASVVVSRTFRAVVEPPRSLRPRRGAIDLEGQGNEVEAARLRCDGGRRRGRREKGKLRGEPLRPLQKPPHRACGRLLR